MPRSRIAFPPLLGISVLALLALGAAPAAGQDSSPPSLLAWMGLEEGDTMAFAASDGGRICVTVGAPRRIGDRSFAPLFGLTWPGLASDSRILVPLDGTLDLAVDRTPGPRPSAESFLEPDGWRTGTDWRAAETLVYSSCPLCVDAGTTVVLEKGHGIVSISRQSIVGPTSLTRVGGGCAERDEVAEEVEFEVYVEPAPARDP
jgi:hypothetical protein